MQCEGSPRQENFSASTDQVKCSCVLVSAIPGPLSFLLKRDVAEKGKGAVTAPFFRSVCIGFFHMCVMQKQLLMERKS